ncbi:MAG: AAA family ATPase [Patescibacteria group bacterium]|jgi:chromosome segregation protein
MYLQKLEIQGFKSFAEKTVLEFNRDLTAVVGPNGSGKSNIADSVRWVLGEQSLKLLRGKKSQDVIFAGSTNKARLGFAEVSLFLNNEDGKAPIDYREIVITRRIYRDGETEYLINKNKVRLLDVQMLLAKANFGVRTYAIIGQGMIDSILTSSPTERKEFFDEATGVREYQLKKDQAMLKLERSKENLTQAEQLLQEIEPRLRSLTRQVKRLERKEELTAKLRELQTVYYSRQLTVLDEQLANIQIQLKNGEKDQANLETQLLKGQQELDQEQLNQTQAQAFSLLQNQYQNLSTERNRLSQELSLLKAKQDLDLTKAGKVDLVWLQNRLLEINNEQQKFLQEENNCQQELFKLEKLLATKVETQNGVLAEFEELQNKLLQNRQNGPENSQVTLKKFQEQLRQLYQKQAAFIGQIEKISNLEELKNIKELAQELLQNLKQMSVDVDTVGQVSSSIDFNELQKQLADFIKTKDSLVNEIHGLKIKTEVAKQKLIQTQTEQIKLKTEEKKIVAELSTYQNQGKQIDNADLKNRQTELEQAMAKIDGQVGELKIKLETFSASQEQERHKFMELQRGLRETQSKLNLVSAQLNGLKVELARLETKKEDLGNEIKTEFIGEFVLQTNPEPLNLNELLAEINRYKNQLSIIGGIDEDVAKEYAEVNERYVFLNEQVTDLQGAIESCLQIIEELDQKITSQFEVAFEKINEKFEHYFKILFNGGQAKLTLEKKVITEEVVEQETLESNPVAKAKPKIEDKRLKTKIEFGIEIQATPPGKRLKSINTLSGGEKALTSIALISAIIANNPSPFVILDEVDAALDESNSIRFASIVKELSTQAQFICVTHNRATMHQAAILYGVTMGADGISKLLSINLTEAEKVAETS